MTICAECRAAFARELARVADAERTLRVSTDPQTRHDALLTTCLAIAIRNICRERHPVGEVAEGLPRPRVKLRHTAS
jgi:hypothetical protein